MKSHVLGALGLLALPPMCGSNDGTTDPASVPVSVTINGLPSAPTQQRSQVLVPVLPVSAFSDAAIEDKTLFQQAKENHERGQNWVARLLIEKTALGPNGTKDEAELLLDICKVQGDSTCVQACATKLGRKILFDGGVAVPGPPGSGSDRPPETPFTKARDLHLQKKDKEARAILEPRLLDGKGAPEETRLLLEICTTQKDKMCMVLCKKQLGG